MAVSYVMDPNLGLFRPYSYDELLKLPKEETEAQLKIQDAYDKMQAEAGMAAATANEEDRNSPLFQKMIKYRDNLNAISADISDNGLNSNSAGQLYDLKSMYNTDIKPIENAQTRKAALVAAEIKAPPRTLFNFDAQSTSLEDYYANPYLTNKSINLDDIAKQTNELATKLSTVDLTPGADMQHTINPDVDILHNMKGISAEDLVAWRQSGDLNAKYRLLNQARDYLLKANGLVEFDEVTGAIKRDDMGNPIPSDEWKNNPEAVRQSKDQIEQYMEFALGDSSDVHLDSAAKNAKDRAANHPKDDPGYDLTDNTQEAVTVNPSKEMQEQYKQETKQMDKFQFTSGEVKTRVTGFIAGLNGDVIPKYENTTGPDLSPWTDKGNLRSWADLSKHIKKPYLKQAKLEYDRLYNLCKKYNPKGSKIMNRDAIKTNMEKEHKAVSYPNLPSLHVDDAESLINNFAPGALVFPDGDTNQVMYEVTGDGLDKYGVARFKKGAPFSFKAMQNTDAGSYGPAQYKISSLIFVGEGIIVCFNNGTKGLIDTEKIQSVDARRLIESLSAAESEYAKHPTKFMAERYNQKLVRVKNSFATMYNKNQLAKAKKGE